MLISCSPSKNVVSMTTFPFKTRAGIICDSGAASIKLCQVFVEFGMTNPNSNFHSSKQRFLYKTYKIIFRMRYLLNILSQRNTSILELSKIIFTSHFTFCSRRNFSIGSIDEKFISRDTAAHFNIFFGTLASCSCSP